MDRLRVASLRITGHQLHFAAMSLVVLLACGLYLPFLGNPLVFDDFVVFYSNQFAYFATHPVGLAPRAPAYFSLAAVEVIFGRVEVHRLFSLVFHVACALSLYGLTRDVFRIAGRQTDGDGLQTAERHAAALAMFSAAAFAIHPAAVYAAGYLVQRSIVVATLCGLLSLRLFVHGVTNDRFAMTLAAAGLYSLAVLAKEHSILVAAVAVPLVMLVQVNWRARIKHLALYLVASSPAAILVVLMLKQLIGMAYEPHVEVVAAQSMPVAATTIAPHGWFASAVTQFGLFFHYLALWIWPDTARMAIDLRLDPWESWTFPWIALKVTGFSALGGLGVAMLLRGGRVGVMGLGLLYAWILFLVELSVVRFQEPFVVYRSYLWAPGIALMSAALLSLAGTRVALAVFVLCVPLLFAQARDRLETFSSPLRLWEDSAAKLPDHAVPLGWRVLYSLGRAYLYEKQPEKALEIASRCLAVYPNAHQCVFARGAIRFENGEYDLALADFLAAESIEPKSGVIQHRIGLALERLGRMDDAKERYRKAWTLGYRGGEMELSRLGVSTSANPSGAGAKP